MIDRLRECHCQSGDGDVIGIGYADLTVLLGHLDQPLDANTLRMAETQTALGRSHQSVRRRGVET